MFVKKWPNQLLIYVSLFFLLLFTLLPNLWLVSSSLKPDKEIFHIVPHWIPETFTLDHYKWLFSSTGLNLGTLMYNSIFVSGVTALITCVFAATGGYALGRFNFPGSKVIGLFLLLSQMFQGPLIMIPWYQMASNWGVLNTKLVLILIYGTATIPIGVWLMMGFFKTLPKELEESAMIDGCNKLQVFTKIYFPLVKPGLVAVLLYSFILSWNDYQYALILTSSIDAKTIQLGIAELMDSMGKANWGGIMAAGVATTIPIILLFAFIQRQLIEGLTAGSVKG
ncbi:carbohydrate ABC transporter permease [Neobacillus sedimentimangrovi]|uniref:carbohydrate ABC transporter permease n=1 Tax=Neobacillus sedimentimangrovi TaxID=2699460 RepID=UPI0013CF62C2|nr:carbohydrate ABC transporter permease [Neobacillus sedimentimangrovi]